MKALLVHPGTQHAFHLARQLERSESLSRFWTGFAYDPDTLVGRQIACLPAWAQRRFAGRRLIGLPPEKIRTRPFTDLRALNRLRVGQDEQRVMFERNADFQRQVPLSEVDGSDIVIGFDTASWLLADSALSLGRNFVLDRTTGHPLSFERLLPQLNEQFPQWMERAHCRLPELLAAENAEHDKAHRIIVGSSFNRRTLLDNGVPAEKIAVAPLGVDLDTFTPTPRPDLSRPLRFVFIGRLRAAKGIPLLLQVWRSLGNTHAELWLVGAFDKQHAPLINPLPGLSVLGKIPGRELPSVLRQCDVLVFPSYFEGFGAVLLEAMAAGLPVIATDSTGAPDVMTNGVEGYVVPTGDAAALKDAMQHFLDSPEILGRMSAAARRCAERHSWDEFGDRWMEILRQTEHVSVPDRLSPVVVSSDRSIVDDKPNGRPYHPVKALLFHPGTQHSYQLAAQLQQRGCLGRFWTGMAYLPNTGFGRGVQLLPTRVQSQLASRRLEGVPANHVRTLPFLEWRALHRLQMGHEQQAVMFERNASFQRHIPQRELAKSDVVIGFDTSSWLLAERAEVLDRVFILDQTTVHPMIAQQVLPVLQRQFPEWIPAGAGRLPRLFVAEQAEHRYASRIVTASSFTRLTLIENGVPAEKIVVNPYGVDLEMFSPSVRPFSSRPFRFIFVGGLTASKGLPLLLKVWRELAPRDAEMWVVGSSKENVRLIPSLPGLHVVGKVQHHDLSRLFRQCDVLVLPSYYEGFGMVLLEALAAGLPIISTDATAAPDLITNGVEGYVIPVGDAAALREAMQLFVNSSADLAVMSRAARSAAERFSWEAYGNRWLDLIQEVV